MDKACLCCSVHSLARGYDEDRLRSLIPALNQHLKDVRILLGKARSLNRHLEYRVTPTNERTSKAFTVSSVNLAPVNQICQKFRNDVDGFWASPTNGSLHAELQRRFACVVIYLRSVLDPHALVPPQIARHFPENFNYADVRHSGRKYVKIAAKVGGPGGILWLPTDIPHSTYERYLNIDDEQVFARLVSLKPSADHYTDFARRLVFNHLQDNSLSSSYHNLAVNYGDWIPPEDHIVLLLYALGGVDIPNAILEGIRSPQRRWNDKGEIETISAADFGIAAEIIDPSTGESNLSRCTENPYIINAITDDGVVAWSLRPEVGSYLSKALLPRTVEEIGTTALKLICFTCPPCYEGNTTWAPSLKNAIWAIFQRALAVYKLQPALKTSILEAILFFGERDSVPIRHVAVSQAQKLLRKSMPYYLHATVVLFQSTLYRVDGEFARSEATIREFMTRGPKPSTRRDHALQGRLHISQIENMIKVNDNDVPSSLYKWEAEQPLSSLDIEVMFRLQSTAARFFQSIGNFAAARASLEQFLCLDTTKPIRRNTRRILVGRLADIYSEMQDPTKAAEILQPELERIAECDRARRGFRRLLLAAVEANIGLGRLIDAQSMLEELMDATEISLDDLHDQQLYMRGLICSARIAHMQTDMSDAVTRWRFALREVESMYTLKAKEGFTAAVVYLSLAHAQVRTGDVDGGRHSWNTGVEILKTERCEFWMPVVPTVWLHKIAVEVNDWQGWSMRLMVPGGKPDVTWPS